MKADTDRADSVDLATFTDTKKQARTLPTDRSIKPGFKVGSRTCQCGECNAWFASVSTFDKHRTGPWDNRRCRTPKEMLALGLEPNEHGVWLMGHFANPEGAKKRGTNKTPRSPQKGRR